MTQHIYVRETCRRTILQKVSKSTQKHFGQPGFYFPFAAERSMVISLHGPIRPNVSFVRERTEQFKKTAYYLNSIIRRIKRRQHEISSLFPSLLGPTFLAKLSQDTTRGNPAGIDADLT